MFLIILLTLITAAISGSAAFFSVFGLAQLFSGAAIPAIVMAASLEAGKLITASFLYQHWKNIKLALKTYLIFAMLGLMAITSIGIFGYLSSAYQKDTIVLKNDQQKIDYLAHEKTEYLTRLQDINEQIKEVPSDQVNRKIRLIKTLNSEKQDILNELSTVNKQLEPLVSNQVSTEAKVGPIIFVAKILGKSPDDATLYLIFIIMSVFDPLAVALTIATNFAVRQRNMHKEIEPNMTVPIPAIDATPEIPAPIDHTDALDNISNKLDKVHSILSVHDARSKILSSIRDIDN